MALYVPTGVMGYYGYLVLFAISNNNLYVDSLRLFIWHQDSC